MGMSPSTIGGHYKPTYYGLPHEVIIPCSGNPRTCRCVRFHRRPQYVYAPPGFVGGAVRYYDPMSFFQRPYGGGFNGLGMGDPKDWTLRDLDVLEELFREMCARRRGRRMGSDDDGGNYEEAFGSNGGGGRGRGNQTMREMLALLEQARSARRLTGVEHTIYGSEEERKDAAFRERLNRLLGEDGGGGNGNGNGRTLPGGLGGGNAAARFERQQREQERRERDQRNLDREDEELRRHLERMQDQRDLPYRERGLRPIDDYPFWGV